MSAMNTILLIVGGVFVALWVFYWACLIVLNVATAMHKWKHPPPPDSPTHADVPPYGSEEWLERVRSGDIKY